MEQLLNDGWQFCKLPLGSTLEDVSNAALQAVDLPHDFLIENENDLYETTDAWYLRTLDVPESWCASCGSTACIWTATCCSTGTSSARIITATQRST